MPVSTDETTKRGTKDMEPVHIYALLQQQGDAQAHWREIEQRLAARANLRRRRLDRRRRLRRLLVRRPPVLATPQHAV